MPLVAFTCFECGDNSDITSTSGTVSYVTSPVHSGTYAFRANPTTTATGYAEIRKFAATGTQGDLGLTNMYALVPFRYATKPASASEPFFGTNGTKPTVRINSSGNIELYDSTGTLAATGTAVLAANTWYDIGLSWGTNTATAIVQVDGVTDISASINCGSAVTQRVRAGKIANANGQTVDFYYGAVFVADDAIPDTNMLGGVTIPATDVSVSQWATGTGTTFAEIDEIPGSDTDYLMSSGAANDAFLCGVRSMDSSSIPAGATISGIFVRARHRDNTSVTSSTKLDVKSGTTTSSTTGRDATGATSTCGFYLMTDPNTGAAWTRAAIDAMQVGMTETTATQQRCTSIIIQVAYIPAAPAPSTSSPFICIVA